MTPPKSPFPHPSLPNGLLWVSSLGTRYQRKRERQGQAGVGRGLQSIQSLTWDPGPCLPPSHGCCRSPTTMASLGPQEPSTTLQCPLLVLLVPAPEGWPERSRKRHRVTFRVDLTLVSSGRQQAPRFRASPPPLPPKRASGVRVCRGGHRGGLKEPEMHMCLPTTQSLGPDHLSQDTLCSRSSLRVRVPGTGSSPRDDVTGSPGITDTSTWKVGSNENGT